jgi:hypothetical protein
MQQSVALAITKTAMRSRFMGFSVYGPGAHTGASIKELI